MGLTLVTPATNPVTMAEAKAWCRADGTAHGAAVEIALAGAFSAVEAFLGRSLGAQTWRLSLDGFSDVIELPRGPVTAVESFEAVGLDGVARAVDPDLWTLDLVSDPQWIVLNADASWPAVLDAVNVVTVQFVAGYSVLPGALKLAVLSLTAQAFDNRTAPAMTPEIVQSLSPWRRLLI